MATPTAGYARAREGLDQTTENTAATVAALVREMEGYEARATASRVDKNDETAEKWDNRAEQVREQLRVRGQAPHSRATKRQGRPGQEARA